MKVGILTYHYVYNFGANLQALSTLYYFLSRGYDAKIIDWQPNDTKSVYDEITEKCQREAHEKVWKYYKLTRRCNTNESVLSVIDDEQFDAVIIGSDAVLQYRPILSDLMITRKLIPHFFYRLQEQSFPNPFLGLINENEMKVAYMSVSAQNAPFKTLTFIEKKRIRDYFKGIGFVTVRDIWTQDYIRKIERKRRVPVITPDPVFAFNYNCDSFLKNEEELFWEKYSFLANKKYILVSFKNKIGPKNSGWVKSFDTIASQNGYEVYSLPFPQENNTFNLNQQIRMPVSPLEWYLLIKNSQGYVGNNMHPIVSSIHNRVPFFVFDHYTGKNLIGSKSYLYQSKVYDLLNNLGLINYYYNTNGDGIEPSPESVFESLVNFKTDILNLASETMLDRYKLMMKDLEAFINE